MAPFDFNAAFNEGFNLSQQPPSAAVVAQLFTQLQQVVNEGQASQMTVQRRTRRTEELEKAINDILNKQVDDPGAAALKEKAQDAQVNIGNMMVQGLADASSGDPINIGPDFYDYVNAMEAQVENQRRRAQMYRHVVREVVRDRNAAWDERR
jgi:hypothetical protein